MMNKIEELIKLKNQTNDPVLKNDLQKKIDILKKGKTIEK